MRRLSFKYRLLPLFVALMAPLTLNAGAPCPTHESIIELPDSSLTKAEKRAIKRETRYKSRVTRYMRTIPSHTKIQMYGDMGLVSLGFGWDYGRHNQWESDILFGVVPKYSDDKAKLSMSVKQNYIPWKKSITDNIFIEPLTCGLYLNTVFGDQFWTSEPSRYPQGYYGFSSRIRIHIFLGERITFAIPYEKRFFAREVSLFYEISTCELYLISAFTNKHMTPKDYLRLSFGVKFQIL